MRLLDSHLLKYSLFYFFIGLFASTLQLFIICSNFPEEFFKISLISGFITSSITSIVIFSLQLFCIEVIPKLFVIKESECLRDGLESLFLFLLIYEVVRIVLIFIILKNDVNDIDFKEIGDYVKNVKMLNYFTYLKFLQITSILFGSIVLYAKTYNLGNSKKDSLQTSILLFFFLSLISLL